MARPLEMLFHALLFDGENESVDDEPNESPKSTADPTAEETVVGDTADEKAAGSSRRTKFLQGAVGFVVMFVVLYLTLRKLTGEDSD
ncbi:hypothetical protein [Natrarchaeobaculum sulfurireducens]|uniref:Uncharacterized protein n=1 Tax=Natrarchaeobaculum sulfurireducens TaxID=2044521 RepID=A0A346PBL5_9EURY|nr:hypothetical protein [Natrarchaeobaculum sulfurireducens]AXR76910.1 hypothetical protein AArc1_0566 [Natrarchaeobaculum sulfurireducens]AXR80576.1 hypothetical protein AArcMg_0553 [Natrarchaeobaculum sulfurireducens]